MPRNPRIYALVENGFYHILARGNNKKHIFNSPEDYLKLKELLSRYKKKYDAELLAYCLMPNHYHLFLRGGLFLPDLMRVLNTQYARYFNKKYRSTGHLFGDRYKSLLVANDPYLITLIRYIHNNPVRTKLVEDASDYEHSSLKEYSNKAELIDKKLIYSLIDHTSKGTYIAQILS